MRTCLKRESRICGKSCEDGAGTQLRRGDVRRDEKVVDRTRLWWRRSCRAIVLGQGDVNVARRGRILVA